MAHAGFPGDGFATGVKRAHNRYADYFASRLRVALTIDIRTASEYGVVRTFGQANF